MPWYETGASRRSTRVVRYFFNVRRCGDKFLFKKTHVARRPTLRSTPMHNPSTVLPVGVVLSRRGCCFNLFRSAESDFAERNDRGIVHLEVHGPTVVSCPNRETRVQDQGVSRCESGRERRGGTRFHRSISRSYVLPCEEKKSFEFEEPVFVGTRVSSVRSDFL